MVMAKKHHRPGSAMIRLMQRHLRIVFHALGLLCLLSAHSSTIGQEHAAGLHHRPQGFQNNYTAFEPKGFFELLRWRLDAARNGLPPPGQPTPQLAADLDFIRTNAVAGPAMQPAVTWIGHATVLAQFGGINVITDPMFSERASPIGFLGPKRHLPPGVALRDLPRLDAVLISHNHYDHLDAMSVRALNAQAGGPPLFVVPLGMKPWFAEQGIDRVVALDWWQSHKLVTSLGEAEIVLTPVQHWSGRGLTDRLSTLWGGFAVFAPDFHLFFAGDTGYSKDFADIRARFAERQRDGGFDIALLPVGAYEPRWFMAQQHVNPAEAVQIHLDLAAQRSLGVHWGTFELTDEALDVPPRDLALARKEKRLSDEQFFVLAVGETRKLPRRVSK
jgi:N-acyl-phosphatidylethanolamine-hydrolysing phospholipase D